MTKNIRGQHGYQHEHHIVEQFRKHNYLAYRIGPSTTDMPDIMAWPANSCNYKQPAYTIECKSSTTQYTDVPDVQVQRTHKFALHFPYPGVVIPVLSFMFRNGPGRKPTKYDVKCPAWGHILFRRDGLMRWRASHKDPWEIYQDPLQLVRMPWHMPQPHTNMRVIPQRRLWDKCDSNAYPADKHSNKEVTS